MAAGENGSRVGGVLHGVRLGHIHREGIAAAQLFACRDQHILIGYQILHIGVHFHHGILHQHAVAHHSALFHVYAAEQNAVFHRALNNAAIGDHRIAHLGPLHIAGGVVIAGFGVDGAIFIEQLVNVIVLQKAHIFIKEALEVCNAVSEVWKPSPDDKVIYNLPVTVELSMPHVYANQIEYMSKNLNYRENIILSLHPHNDRGCGVADTEMGLLAGADRVEGTLFGNGERTGNADIVTIGMNMYSQGVDPELDFSNLPKIQEVYEKVTRMTVPPRSPYCGQLVFSAFSGSHQDAIAKGMKYREEKGLDTWTVPYLPLDPTDVGRDYDSDVIRVNSQSGRGGIGYILESQYKYDLPKAMRGDFSYQIKEISDHEHRELKADEIFKIFEDTFVNKTKWLKIVEYHFVQEKGGVIGATVTLDYNGHLTTVEAKGNGRLDAVSNAIKTVTGNIFTLDSYNEHSIERKQSDDTAAAYVGIVDKNGNKYWGVGTNHDIINASVKALASAINNELE